MAYIALYRKFRPKTFDELVGQDHIVKTLKNQIINNRIGHAYLFSGGRGSGKTSTAKILSRAVNCLHPVNGEPCNECEICRQALEGSLVDITEMDAASNNGVDNIRDIRDEVEFIPTSAKYRVYIIDEVHMLSTGAFNALLKTLEEPPAHVIFILATTEPQKLPTTILSRCQRFDFKKISVENIVKRLKIICKENDINIEENALKMIAVLADGAMRDAISILDRCTADGKEQITEDMVKELVGVPKFDFLINIMDAIINCNIDNIISISEELISEGKDINIFTWELIKLSRDLLVLSTCKELDNYNEGELNRLKELSAKSNKDTFIKIIEELSTLSNSIKWSSSQEIIFEAGLIKLSSMLNSKEIHNEANVNTLNEIGDLKFKVLTNLKENGKILLRAKLESTNIEIGEEGLVHIVFNEPVDSFTKTSLQKGESKQAIKEAVINAIGRDIGVKYVNLKGKEE